MTTLEDNKSRGFTLLEVMIIVALIGLLTVLATPSYVKVRKQAQGKRIVNDARVIDAAVDSWVMEKNKADGDQIDLPQAAQYAKTGQLSTNDVLGNPYTIGLVGTTQVRIATASKSALAGVSIDWSGY